MSKNAILQVREVVSGYITEIDIIRKVSFDVIESEILSIIGPNGAGKSTMLKTIFRLLKIKSGTITLDGQDITRSNSLDVLRMGISFVPQGRCNFPMMTVKENLEMGAFSRADDDVEKDIAGVIERFPLLHEKRNELAGNLSGGQQQILEMGMALTLNPKIMLLDEPTLGLAPKVVYQIFEEIKKINDSGCTIVMVEQNAKRALAVSDHAIVLELGQKRFEGTGEEIMNSQDVKTLYLGGK
ncbi:MAG: ABC transporter ATP-binding protein [Theionarchaea archaeon]|nr:ABC transporter ATP-binding protein [Theionarchaea archaeon]